MALLESLYLIVWSETNIYHGCPFFEMFHRGGPWSPAPACIHFPGAMPKGDTWPGGVAAEPLSNMDSAGSYDSVISTNSGYVSSDPLTSVPLTLLLYSWLYNTNCWRIPTSTVGCDSLLDIQVEMWKHFKKTFLKGDQFDDSTISEHKPKSRKSKETVRAFYFLLQGCCIAPP